MALYANMYEVTYQPGEIIIPDGQPGRNFYHILSVRGPRLSLSAPGRRRVEQLSGLI